MSRYYSYLNSAREILALYKGEEPFASFLKKYFKQHKKFGSNDRKQVSHLCYCYFRLGKAVTGNIEERILTALFLCSRHVNELLQQLKPAWNESILKSTGEKLSMLSSEGYGDLLNNIFPWKEKLSGSISYADFSESFLVQPDLYLRLRPGNEKAVKEKLRISNIDFTVIGASAVGLNNTVNIESVIDLDREAVIQDLSSQKTGDLLFSLGKKDSSPMKVWDCCAASGGKSIMAVDILGNIDLTVSDIRKSILYNLRERFSQAGITKYKSFVADLSKQSVSLPVSGIDLIIADAPCTGSGTWGRTPEQLFYFDEKEIEKYVSLQKSIAGNSIAYLEAGGFLLYITCSVFRSENENIIEYLSEKFPLSVIKMEVIRGYNKKADTMFAALLQKTL